MCSRWLLRLLRNKRGSVAPIFALAIIPAIGLVGAAVDYSRAASIRGSMQSAIDATALAMAKRAPLVTKNQLEQETTAYFNATFSYPDAKNVTVVPVYTTVGGSQLVLTSTSTVDTTFMKVMGFSTIKVGSTSTVKWGNSRLRVALVLDTTGSMSDDGKMAAMQSATKALITQIKDASPNTGDAYVSIIPFSKNVNVGPSNHTAAWIDWTGWEEEPAIIKTPASKPSGWSSVGPGSTCPFTTSSHGFRCAPDPTSTSTTDTIPSSGTFSGYICPSTDSGGKNATKIGIMYNGCYSSVPTTTTATHTVESGKNADCNGYSNCSCTGSGNGKVCSQTVTTTGAPYTHPWIKNAHSTWNGCVGDRGAPGAPSGDYDRVITAPTPGNAATLFPAEQNSYCSPAIVGLNDKWATMATTVGDLYPSGATNQPIGLIWGWQSLVGGGPLTMPVKDTNYTYTDVIVLLSDGLNTLDRWYGNGSSTNSWVDQRMYESATVGTCANINAANITVYTVQVNTGGDATSTLLKNCAGSPPTPTAPRKFPDSEKSFMVTTTSGLGPVFKQIGTQLSKLRISN